MLDRRSLLVAGASFSLASIMLPRLGAQTPSYCRSPRTRHQRSFKVLVLSRTMFGVAVVDVANKNTPITGAQVTLISRYAAGKQLTATTDDEGTAIFEVAPLFRSRYIELLYVGALYILRGLRDGIGIVAAGGKLQKVFLHLFALHQVLQVSPESD